MSGRLCQKDRHYTCTISTNCENRADLWAADSVKRINITHAPYQSIARIELVYERPIVSKGSTLQMHPFNQLRSCFYPDDARRWILTVPHCDRRKLWSWIRWTNVTQSRSMGAIPFWHFVLDNYKTLSITIITVTSWRIFTSWLAAYVSIWTR